MHTDIVRDTAKKMCIYLDISLVVIRRSIPLAEILAISPTLYLQFLLFPLQILQVKQAFYLVKITYLYPFCQNFGAYAPYCKFSIL